ncbi:MAG: D-alanine--D-alanine ligase [Corynebacteriales bacterium]|nr:D-alanine--D-alanine ligase [Mycobacteriales bacterium]
MSEKQQVRVAVVFGGRSSEHAISCLSAKSVMAALEDSGYEVTPVGITTQGRWVLPDVGREALGLNGRELPAITSGESVVLPPDPTAGGLVVMQPADGARRLADVDVVFPVLHGPYGEDGTIQGLLEMAGVPYVGAGVLSSAVGMDKEFTKRLLAGVGLNVGEYAVLRPGQELSTEDKERLGLPVFVKPARAGSSVGVSKVNDWAELDAAIATARAADPKVLVEKAIVGREVECAVLESQTPGAEPDASLPAEIRFVADHDWYDFDAKYLDEVCEFDLPAKLPDEITERVRDTARQVFTALDGAGLARVDVFVTDDYEVVVNEINTMPGFTPISMFPRMWGESGISYPELVSRLVKTALARGTGLR